MFTALYLNNYMSFKDLKLDLSKGNRAKSLISIYGENGSGKSNLVSAFVNLSKSVSTLQEQAEFIEFQKKLSQSKKGDSKSENNSLENRFLDMIDSFPDIDILNDFKNSYMLGTKEPMILKYEFEFNGHNGYYKLRFSKNKNGKLFLSQEKLYYLIKKSSGVLFDINSDESSKLYIKVSPKLFGTSIKKLAFDDIERLWGKHTFLSIINQIAFNSNKEYIKKNVSNNLMNIINMFINISYKDDHNVVNHRFKGLINNTTGIIDDNEENRRKINTTENSLNQYFVPLYSDIIRLNFDLSSTPDGKLKYKLFEKKRISNNIINIPFSMESNGTKRLFNLFPLFLHAVHGEVVIIDEIDQGIHDLLMDRIISSLDGDIAGQLIFTTHDTQLMKELKTNQVYIIKTDVEGNKIVTSLTQNGKIGTNNNVQKLYINGYFAGIPYSSDIDFYEILQDLEENYDGL